MAGPMTGRKLPAEQTGVGGQQSMSSHRQVSVEAIDDLNNGGAVVATTVAVQKKIIDEAGGGVTYIGESSHGAALADPKWRIQRITEAAPITTIEWAQDATSLRYADFDQIWDGRAALTYG